MVNLIVADSSQVWLSALRPAQMSAAEVSSACLPCVVAAEGELLTLIVHEDTILHPDKSLSSCMSVEKASSATGATDWMHSNCRDGGQFEPALRHILQGKTTREQYSMLFSACHLSSQKAHIFSSKQKMTPSDLKSL